ncbi:AAA family ATPase [Oscillatoria sp. FACHB-1406]|nr:AAA family ATPase [Oscillatoria sp. FACHB-1406]
MRTMTIASLSGGQGKTTTAFFLSRLLSASSKVLVVDADPQANLTFFLGHEVEANAPTLLEMITGTVEPLDSIYKLSVSNLFLVPADDGLTKAQDYLAASGMGAVVLRNRLQQVAQHFDYCIIDAPPTRSQIVMSAVGAADWLLIPAEALTKGVNSLVRTLELASHLDALGAFAGRVLGIVPFRDRWFGNSQSTKSAAAIKAIKEIAAESQTEVFPSILESERYKQALDEGILLSDFGYPNLELPFKRVIERL